MPETNGQEIVTIKDNRGLPRMESVERIAKLPVVEQTVDLASNIYGKVKDSNQLVNTVLTTAETTVRGAVDKTLPPVTARFEGSIKKVDSLLCSSLDYVETKIPAVKLQPDEIVRNTKDYVYTLPGVKCACQIGEQGVKKAVQCACAVGQFGTQKLNDIKDCLTTRADEIEEKDDAKSLLSVYLVTVKRVLLVVTTWLGVSVYLGILFPPQPHATTTPHENNKHNSLKERKDHSASYPYPNGTNSGYGTHTDTNRGEGEDLANHKH